MLGITQKKWVQNILVQDGKITRNKCLINYVSRLGAIIAILKEDGFEFETQYVEVKTPFGTGKDYEYKVVKYPVELQKQIDFGKIDKKADDENK